jgi:hypothetical protein
VIENADLAVLTFLTGFSGKSSIFDHLVNAVARLDLFKGLALMCLFWFTWAHVEPNQTVRGRDERHERLVNVVIGSLLMVALARVLQLALHWHQRPLLSNLNLPFPLLESGALHLSGWNSFPSDGQPAGWSSGVCLVVAGCGYSSHLPGHSLSQRRNGRSHPWYHRHGGLSGTSTFQTK